MTVLAAVKKASQHQITKTVVYLGFILTPFVATESNLQLFIFWGINILLAQSINLLSGFAGQISLGHAAFYAIGAYTSAVMMIRFGLPIYATIILAAVLNGLVGYLLSFPARRVKEFYLAMMTLGFGFIIQEIAKEWSSITGGVMGLSNIPSPKLGTLTVFGIQMNLAYYYWIVLFIVMIFLWMLKNFIQSYFGRSFLAVHRSELSASSIGISPGNVKQLAYILSATIAGIAGALYAHLMAYIGSDTFGMMQSVEILVMGILGGFGTIIGPILGAGFLTFVPNKLQFIQEYQLMIYSLLLIVSFLAIPEGFAGLLKLRTELSKSKKIRKMKFPANTERNTKIDIVAPKQERSNRPILTIKNVVKDFDGLRALNDVSIELFEGEILGLIGPNGSGKSTLVNVISGVYQVSAGNIHFKADDITNLQSHLIAKKGIIRTFQDPHNVPNLTVKENLLLGRHRLYDSGILSCTFNLKSSIEEEKKMLEKVQVIMGLCELEEYENELVGNLPYGIQRTVEVGRAILAEPRLLLLDEPAAGLSENELKHLIRLIRFVQQKNIPVILIDHHMEFVTELVDKVVVLDSGIEIYTGDVEGMQTNGQVIEAYLGVAKHA
ncbi:branched-chain amino acid ABC transporter permease [Bacillus sp. V3-13]|uniref:branched-chain amino acid ABC transporter ATP-binding protein/permease n=1 Tax=Bacillus sp. V3-13 TaxID=2053728 RepID=UPI000C78C4FF|nr:branched-chain amino acid ABC transporter ATP-binding protein/permease [Bacillus sp. V3-13]PLR78616.1 branched-chain amino acid ABC transporter permease [Bacillus sp. V3-13]